MATLETLFGYNVIPIINENDTISTYEIEFGDNDTLSAYVARLIQADLLVLLTDIEGLYDSDPRKNLNAKLIGRVEKITDSIRALAGGSGTARGTGGMATKLDAAEIAAKSGISTIIANGEHPKILYDIVEGKPRGTFFMEEYQKERNDFCERKPDSLEQLQNKPQECYNLTYGRKNNALGYSRRACQKQ